VQTDTQYIRKPNSTYTGWEYMTQREAVDEMTDMLQFCVERGCIDSDYLQALYDLTMRIPEDADIQTLQRIAEGWALE
jgi:hypothetical protein